MQICLKEWNVLKRNSFWPVAYNYNENVTLGSSTKVVILI